jgi:predicted PurR-regulated permease PerM
MATNRGAHAEVRGDESLMPAGQAPSPPVSPTPIFVSPRTRWLLVGGVLAVLGFLLWVAPPARTMVVGGLTLAMFFSLPMRALSRHMRRGLAMALLLVAIVAMFVAAVLIIVPTLIDQLESLIASAPQTHEELQVKLADVLQPLERFGIIQHGPETAISSLTEGTFNAFIRLAGWLLSHLVSFLENLASTGFVLFGTAMVAIYVLVDINRYRGIFLLAFPRRYQADAAQLWSDLGDAISRYLGGLAIAMADQGILVTLMLWIVGVPYAALFGIWMAFTSILPYIGAWLAAAPAVIVVFFERGLLMAVIVALGYVAINFWDSNFVQPAVFGHQIRVPPLFVFLGIVIGSQVGGLLGTIAAMPILAMCRVTLDFLRDRLHVVEPAPASTESGDVGAAAAAPKIAADGESPAAPPRPGDVAAPAEGRP